MRWEGALAAAKGVEPVPPLRVLHENGHPAPGTSVAVTPDDFALAPVEARLVTAGRPKVVIHRRDENVGDLYLHFTRGGFDVKAA